MIPHKLFVPTVERVEILLVSILLFFWDSMKLELEEKRLKKGERSAESINHGLLFHSLFPIVPCSFSFLFESTFSRKGSFKGL